MSDTGQWDEQRYLDYLKRLTADLRSTRRELADVRARSHEPIAVVGAGCRYPGGVTGPDELWDLVDAGGDAIGPFPADRGWPVTDDPAAQGGFLHDAGDFDPGFFAMGPREALATDPQQRLILTVAWEALERAGIDPATLRGSASGVFVGAATSGYGVGVAELPEGVEGHLLAGGATSVISGRTAYHLGWEGPVATVDTACSSSLVAMHLAVAALRRGECSLALAGGVAVMATPAMFAQFSAQQGLSSDGRCKAFSDDADGTSWSEGAGVVLLERLSDARANGRRILGLVRGSAINADGASNGLTAPHGPSQQRVIRAALEDAELGPADVDAVDAHGTGTSLGDPIEAQALLATYGAAERAEPLRLGALKSNLGHTQSAAGIGGVLKMLAAMAHGRLPRTLHADTPSSKVDWSEGAVELLSEPAPWPTVESDDGERPRRAAVSSFGISGTNAHVVLEAAPPVPETEHGEVVPSSAPVAWPVSARCAGALAGQAARLAAVVTDDHDPRAVAHALATTRSTFEHRAVVLDADRDALAALAAGGTHDDLVTGTALRGRTALLFPGQGSQYPAMGRGLADAFPVAAAAFEEIFAAIDPHLDRPLREVLFADTGTAEAALLDDTRWTQPALFAVEVATYRLWESWGVVPQALIGHSVGTLAAAHVAGVLPLADAALLVATRARVMADLPAGGAMLAVAADEAAVRAELDGTGLDLAAVNGPDAVVVSGDADAIDALAARYDDRGIRVRRLRVSHAFHSARMEPALEEFRAVAARCTFAAPRVPIVSDHTGELATSAQLRDPGYWVAHLRHTVRFADAIATARRRGTVRFLEVGPGHALTTAARAVADGDGRPIAVVGGLRADEDAVRAAVLAAARLFVAGGAVEWTALVGPAPAELPALPTYAFDQQRYWMTPTLVAPEPVAATGPTAWERRFWAEVEAGDAEALTRTLGTDPGDLVPALAAWHREHREADALARLRHSVTWQPASLPDVHAGGRWLAVGLGGDGPDEAVLEALRDRGLDVLPAAAPELPDAVAAHGPAGVLALVRPGALPDLLAALADVVRALPDGTRLWVLTRGAVATGPRDPAPDPDLAAVWGAGRAIALERPAVWGGLVDLPADLDRRTAGRLLAVLSGAGEEDQVALRPATALVRRLVPAPPAGPGTWHPRGTVLITGGTGALGAAVARLAARRAADAGADLHLVLAGRRGADAPGAPELAGELRGLGATVTLAAVDTADREALAALVAEHPPHAVVHAAGVGDDTPLATADAAAIAAVVTGKATGAEHLDALTGDLDAFVLFSSISGVWGAGGQLAYAAANARLDALAERRAAGGEPATAVAWGPWSGAGMAADEAAEAHLRRRGLAGLDPDRALAALESQIVAGAPTGVVADVDWGRFLATYTLARPAPLFAALAPAEPSPAAADPDTGPDSDLARRVADAGPAQALRTVLDTVRAAAAAVLGHGGAEDVDPDRTFGELGVDSVGAIDLRDRLAGPLGRPLPATAVFDHPTPRALAQVVLDELTATGATGAGTAVVGTLPGTHDEDDPLVVVGMACRFPGGVDDPEALWRLVERGGDAIGPLPTDRGWDLRGLDDAAGGFLDDVAGFDAGFFGISPREALAMDPQQRLLLETSWEAVERAGIAPSSLRGSRTGVFVGAGSSGYGVGSGLGEEVAGHVLTGTAGSVLSGRVAYVLGTEGPAVTVDTACSSSLVALHWAAAALRAGECDLALVGGATVMATPFAFGEFTAQGGLAHDGRCKAFSDDADGTGWSEGAAVVAVERLSAARAGGHPVLAVVRGSAVNSDGASNGLTAPNGPSQQRVLRAALADAGLEPHEVDAVEAHGTGTRLGDPIEAQALLTVYGGERETPLRLGSVKSNLGHTQAAAGLSGLLKMIKALEHELLPATLHAGTPSRHVDWSAGAVALLDEPVPWPQNGHPRRAGISSFGISGTNAHVVIEQAPEPEKPDDRPVTPVWHVSGHTPGALALAAERLADAVGEADDPVALALAAARRRDPGEHRAVVLDADPVEGLRPIAARGTLDGAAVVTGTAVGGPTGWLLGGQGAQRPGMGRDLLTSDDPALEAFGEALEAAAAAVDAHLDRDLALLDVLLGDDADLLAGTDWAQPALFAVQVAGGRLLAAWGAEPGVIVGHSVGEIAAAHLSGALTLDDAARLVAARADAMARLPRPGGAPMAAVSGPPAALADLDLPDGIVVAARNAATSLVLAGEPDALATYLDGLGGELRVARLRTSHAFHSPAMAPAAEALAVVAGALDWRPPTTPVVSTHTGQLVGPDTWADPAHWTGQLTAPVRFAEAVAAGAAELGVGRWIELGPHPTLTGHVLGDHPDAVVTCLGHADVAGEEAARRAAAVLWTAGDPLPTRLPEPALVPASLPTTPFRHERYWPRPGRLPGGTVTALGLSAPAGGAHPLLGAAVRVAGRDEVVLSGVVSPTVPTWVADHVVPGSADPVLPGTALLDLVVRAGDETGSPRVEDLTLAAPLVVPAAGVRVQVAIGAADDDGRREVTVHSAPLSDATTGWTEHATAVLAPEQEAPEAVPALEVRPPSATAPATPDDVYARLAAGGFAYGPAFRGLTGVWRDGDDLHVEAELPADAEPGHTLHPALLDAVLHGLAAVDALDDPGNLPRGGGLPFSWSGASVYATGATAVRARLRRGPGGGVALEVADLDGAPVARVDELTMRAPVAAAAPAPGADGLHVVTWAPEPDGPAPGDDRLAEVPTRGDDPAGRIRDTAADALALVRAHLASDDPHRLVVVTRHGVAATPGERPDPAQAAVAGLVRAAAAEEPGRVALLDRDTTDDTTDGAAAGPLGVEVAVREGTRLVPRWARAADRDTLIAPAEGPHHLAITEKGSLDHLTLAPFPEADAPLEPGQVRLAVRAVGLNFRDVLNALGMYPGEAGALGSEAAGVVLETADDVERPAVGDRVFGLVPGAAGPRAVADARLLVPVPDGWSDAQAAGAPVVYLTAYRALVDLAAVRPGERLLVHAAAGGVGLATLELARHLGLEVSGTASPGKQHLLRERGLSDDRIASSRDLAFADRLGPVDVVLNSLAGDFVDASMGLLAEGGRFLEMGKTDVRDASGVPDGIAYTAFDMWDAGVARIAEMLAELAALFAAGDCAPLPTTAWDVADAREAFRYVSQARHVGKVVLTTAPEPGPDDLVVVTGGLGGLGAALARHLVERGARRLVLAGRRGTDTPGAADLVAELAAGGADVRAVALDAADPAAVAALAAELGAPALVVHAAGVLDDGVVTAQDADRLAAVLRAKTDAVTVLDAHLAGPGTAMVVFSSVAGVLGAAGQSTYAAANAALDAWATTRRRDGAPRRSLAWGPWGAGAGMTSGLGEADAARMARSGFVVLDPARGTALFDAALHRPEPVVVPAPVDPAALAAAGDAVAPALAGLAATAPRRRAAAAGGSGGDLVARLAALPDDERAPALLATVRDTAAGVLGHTGGTDAVPADRDFRALGFDSLTSVELRNRLSAAVGTRLPATLVFDHPTPRRLAGHLLETLDLAAAAAPVAPTAPVTSPDDDPVVVVGMGLRLPGGVRGPEDYWQLLVDGVDAVGPAPTDRGWEATAGIVGGFVERAGDFDAGFFGIAPREALTMDPQQRLLLETAWEAVERAGIDPATLRGSRTGVYAGTNYQGYGSAAHALPEGEDGPSMTGHAASVTSGRVAYALGLEGPAVTVDTACSSSSVALHWAASALRAGECDLALAGGVTVMATAGAFGEFARQGGLASDGRCKPFSDDADGTGWGEGAGLVLLERLSAARAAGHPVLAVLRGSAINSDGASNGLTAPNGPSQQRVIRDALAAGGLSAADVDAVEAHGTGTSLGDPIEAQALLATYGGADRAAPLLLGSVKSNIGHTQAAAGIAGIAKAVLALQHGVLPPTLHLGEPSSRVDWESGAVRLATGTTDLPDVERPHRIGVSSFGISGTNAHVVLEAAPTAPRPVPAGEPVPGPVLWPVSARDDDALGDRARELLAGPAADTDPAVLAHALATTRTPFARRAVVVGTDRDGLTAGLGALARGEEHEALVRTPADLDPDTAGGLAFVLSGQGAQRAGMGADLLATEPVYAEEFARVCAALDRYLPEPLAPVVLGEGSAPDLVDRTEWTQPALFAVEIALVALVRSWGLRPDLVLGHSVGGLAAAHVAGVLDLDAAARLVAARGALMGEMPAGGAMAALEATEEEVTAALTDGVGIGAVNGPTAVVVSGDADAVDAIAAVFADRGRRTRRLRVSHAFHSAHMDGMRERFAEVASSVTLAPPRLRLVSDLTGALAGDEVTDPDHWVRHVREPVRFGAGLDALLAAGATTILEIGPDASLTPLVAAVAGPDAAVPLVRRDDEPLALARAAATLHVRGALPDLAPRCPGTGDPVPVPLPTYPFRRRRFWLDPARPDAPRGTAWDDEFWRAVEADDLAAVLPGDATDVGGTLSALARRRRRAADTAAQDAWLHAETWVPQPGPAPAAPTGTWTLVTDDDTPRALADGLAAALRAGGADVTVGTDPPAEGRVVLLLGFGGAAGATAAVARAVEALRGGAGPVWAVTRGAVDPGAERVTAGSALWGLGRVAALEHPDTWGGLLDLDPAAGPDPATVLAVLDGGAGGEDQLALRPGGLLARRLHPVPAPADGDGPDLARPVLVTGGTGALGHHVARHLAGRGARHLVLVSRTGGDERTAALADELDGVTVETPACDVADPDAVAALLARTGPPGLVVHAAGVLDDAPLAGLDADRIGAVVTPKAALAGLDAATRGTGTVLVAFTSYAGVVGSPGQGNYAAANALADAVITARRAAGEPGIALAWGPWAGGGMAGGGAEARGGVTPLDPDRACAVLDRLAGGTGGPAVVLVADVDWDAVAAGVAALRPAPLLADLTDAADGPAAGDTPAVADLREAVAGLRPADREERLVTEVRRVVSRVLGHGGDPAAVPAGRAFRDLGLDSLMAVDLRNRLAAGTGLALPPNLLFDHPTATALGAHLGAEMGETGGPTRRSVLDELDRLEALLAGARAGDDERRRIGDRLAELAAAWAPGEEPEDPAAALADADADQVFAFIDNDLGL